VRHPPAIPLVLAGLLAIYLIASFVTGLVQIGIVDWPLADIAGLASACAISIAVAGLAAACPSAAYRSGIFWRGGPEMGWRCSVLSCSYPLRCRRLASAVSCCFFWWAFAGLKNRILACDVGRAALSSGCNPTRPNARWP
jgi:hypothetical protein